MKILTKLRLAIAALLVSLFEPVYLALTRWMGQQGLIAFATLGANMPTLFDVMQRLDPGGNIAKVAEILNETNEILEDMVWIEGNLPTGHRTSVRSGLPTGTWRKLNYGVQPTKSTTVPVTDTTGMLENYAEVDKALAMLNGNTPEWRLSEDKAFIEGMNQDMANTLIYGNTDVNPERFMGLDPRFNDITGPQNADNIIDAGGTGSDNTSIWLIVWGENTVHGIYPKGSIGGLQQQDLGEQTLLDAAGGRYQGYRTHYKWDCGLTVRDWRYVVRACNIDVSDLTKDAASGADLIDLMQQMLELVPNLGAGRPAFYMSRKLRSFLRRQLTNKSNVWLSMNEVAGKKVLQFGEVSVRRTDAILLTEARIV
jgi:hypothetical protein